MEPVYALSGYAEWFWLMAKNWKDVENRNWPLPRNINFNLPIRIYLHASKTPEGLEGVNFICDVLTPEQEKEFLAVDWNKYRGCIIGEITITKCLHKGNQHIPGYHDPSMGEQQSELECLKTEAPQYFSKWFFGEFGFVVKDGVLYSEPIPCKGRLGFFKPEFTERK